MSIENELARIASALEKLAEIGVPAPAPGPAEVSIPNSAPLGVPPQTPAGMVPQVPPPGFGPVPMPTGPAGVPTPPPVSAPGVPGVPPTPAPGVPPTPAPGVTLDDIRAAANDFHRAHPDRATEVMNILGDVGAQKLDQVQPQFYAQVLNAIKALGA